MTTITERIDRITGIPPEYRREVLPAPKSVKIELTGRCNYACKFCARGKELREQADMDRFFYRRLVIDLARAKVQELGLFYLGESLMVSWLEDAIRYAAEAGIGYIFLTTNGSLAKPDRLERCFRAGLNSLKFSLNYADTEQFQAITGSDPRLFELMLRNVIAARAVRDKVEAETGNHCGLYASYIEYDGEQAARMERLLAMIAPYMDEVYALPLYSQAEFMGGDERALGWRVTAGNRGRAAALRDPLPCWSVFTEGHITFDGKLSACCFDHDGRFEMGDLTVTPFMDAWNSREFQKLRRAHLRGDVSETPCAKCIAYA